MRQVCLDFFFVKYKLIYLRNLAFGFSAIEFCVEMANKINITLR